LRYIWGTLIHYVIHTTVKVERLQVENVGKWGEKESKSATYRINGVVDKPRMQQGPGFDVARKGNRVPTSFSMSNTIYDNNDGYMGARTAQSPM
jgi:hypothetical protein